MILKQAIRLKYTTLATVFFISQGLTGCKLFFNEHRAFYAMQKEKTTTLAHQRYKKIDYFISKNDFWSDLKNDFKLIHYTDKVAVKVQIELLVKRPYQLQNKIKYSAPYINYVYQQVKKRNLPGELVLLPFIESTYDPFALNKFSGASGLWQLTPRTAQTFGIRQDLLFDGKRDLHASTHAALDYLTYLNQLFCGNWFLTLAAYDTGEGNVKRALDYNTKRHRSIHFWDLPLAKETTFYIPKLLALSAIIKNPEKYGLKLPAISKEAYLESIDVPQGISLIHTATLANMNIKELKRFNPGFKQPALIPKHPYRLLLPLAYINTFKKNLTVASLYSFNLKRSYYTIKPGDNLTTIAKRHHITIEQLCLWNNLKPNQVLLKNKKLVIIKMLFPPAAR